MPGKILALSTSHVFEYCPSWSTVKPKSHWVVGKWNAKNHYINPDRRIFTKRARWHTYVMIFSTINPTQRDLLALLKSWDRVNILFEGAQAVNTTNGHGQLPRNTLVIFELKPIVKVQEPAMPPVS